jgi:hypothetical protein
MEDQPTNWQRMVAFLAELRKITRLVLEVLSRIKVPEGSMKAVFKPAGAGRAPSSATLSQPLRSAAVPSTRSAGSV